MWKLFLVPNKKLVIPILLILFSFELNLYYYNTFNSGIYFLFKQCLVTVEVVNQAWSRQMV